MPKKQLEPICDQARFDSLCERIRSAGIVGFDTEFISESQYRPRLCLLQFALPDELLLVDPLAPVDLSAWWRIMADDETQVIVHGGREEVRFCLFEIERPPQQLFDVQIAEGFLSRGYPLSYRALVQRVLNHKVSGKETRTDWSQRPLELKQLEYALEDVDHLLEIKSNQIKRLRELDRVEWVLSEQQRFVQMSVDDIQAPDNWRKLSGVQRLSRRDLAALSVLHAWRENVAVRDNRPPRRILRDDLLVEIAHRHPKTIKELRSTRGMERSEYRKAYDEILMCLEQAREMPRSTWPERLSTPNSGSKSEEHVLGRLLGVALANRCASLGMSMPIVGTSNDLRDLVRWHLEGHRGTPPKLATGWRAQVCGDLLTDLLDGQISIRVGDPESDHPLVFEKTESKDAGR